jgi:hypothetical protein
MQLLRQAETSPISRPVDPAKLARKPLLKAETKKGKKTVQTLVSIPETDETGGETTTVTEEVGATPHTEIQYRLLRLGAEMGFDVWVGLVVDDPRDKRIQGRPAGGELG